LVDAKTSNRTTPEFGKTQGFNRFQPIGVGIFPSKCIPASRRLPNGAMVSHPDLVSQDTHAPECPPGFVGEVSVICTAAEGLGRGDLCSGIEILIFGIEHGWNQMEPI
jgi:hypothetical protein